MAKTGKLKSAKLRPLWRNARRSKKAPVIPPGEDYVRVVCIMEDLRLETFRYFAPDILHIPWAQVVEENRIIKWCYFDEIFSARRAS